MELLTGEAAVEARRQRGMEIAALVPVKREGETGDSVRSKTDVAMKNEALCKVLAHNICCLISAFYELGIEAEF